MKLQWAATLVFIMSLVVAVACGQSSPQPIIHEKIVEKTVQVPVEIEKIVVVEKEVEVPIEVEVERIVLVEKEVEVPVERQVEKIVEIPVTPVPESEEFSRAFRDATLLCLGAELWPAAHEESKRIDARNWQGKYSCVNRQLGYALDNPSVIEDYIKRITQAELECSGVVNRFAHDGNARKYIVPRSIGKLECVDRKLQFMHTNIVNIDRYLEWYNYSVLECTGKELEYRGWGGLSIEDRRCVNNKVALIDEYGNHKLYLEDLKKCARPHVTYILSNNFYYEQLTILEREKVDNCMGG